MHPLSLITVALVCAVPAFAALFFVARRWRNFGIVDVAWSAGFIPIVLFYAAAARGDWPYRVFLALLVCAWSARLTAHLGRRVFGHLEHEDGRYRQMRHAWAAHLDRNMLAFFIAQAVVLVALSAPWAVALDARRTGVSGWDVAALLVALVAIGGEAIADAELAAFKRDPSNAGRVCELGLWRVSRHPNYFFEWLVWVAFALATWPVPLGWTGALSAGFMGYLLRFVTGVPYTEEQLLRSKGDVYREYQRRTSAFVPWFPRSRADRRPTDFP